MKHKFTNFFNYFFSLLVVLTLTIGNAWGVDNEFTFPTSGSNTVQYVYALTGTNSSLDGNKLYYSTSQPAPVSANYGIEATKLGLVFKPSENCKLSVKMGNNNSSAATITAKVYKIYKPSADSYLYPLYTGNVGKDAAAAVLSAVGESASSSDVTGNWWKNIKILKYGSSKWQVDGSYAKKTLSGEAVSYTSVYNSLFTATTLNAASTKSDKSKASIQTIQNAGVDYVFQKDTMYLIYCNRSTSNVGFFSVTFEAVSTPSCTSPTIAWGTQPAGGEVGASDFVASVTTTPAEQTVTWTSSVPAVATVTNGTIHYVAPGFTKITAGFTYSGEDYCEETVSVNKDIVVPISTDATGENDKYWYYTTAVPSSSPDNGLNYSGTKSGAGMYGTKLNSDGYAWFVKPAVAGTLRVGAFKSDGSGSNYAVEVYACDNEGTISGDALGTLTTPRAGGVSPTMDIAAEVGGIRIQRSTNSEGILYFVEFKAAPAVVCAATIPGNISKGTASGGTGTITLTAAGSPVSGDTWYWQSAADGVDKTGTSGATKSVSAAGTYYIRSYNTAGDCWSDAKNVTVDAADLLTTISPTLTYDANVLVGNTLSPTLTGNTGSGSVTYALNGVTPAGSLTINSSTGVVTAVTVGGTATVTASIAANGNYAAGAATSGTITVVADPVGSGHVLTWNLAVNTGESSISTTSKSSTSTYVTVTNLANESLTITSAAKADFTSKIEAPASKNNSKYMYVTFTVADGYEFEPTAVDVNMQAVSAAATADLYIVDGNETLSNEGLSVNKGSATHLAIPNASHKTFSGTVTMKMYCYGSSVATYRFGTPITITGTVAAAATKYNLTFAPGTGASGSMSTLKYAAGAEVTLPACTFTAPTGKAFDAWVVAKTAGGASVTVTDGKFTMPAEAVTATATWKATYTVNYYDEDGSTPLGSEEVAVGSHPTASSISAEKDYKILTWLLSSVATDLDDVSAAAGATVDLVASYVPAYASSINIEQWVLDNRKNNSAFRAVLDARYYKYANLNDLDSLTAEKNDGDRNYPFLGQKWKLATSEISFLLKEGSTVKVRFGNMGSSVNVKIGSADAVALTSGSYANSSPGSSKEYSYTATEDVVVKFQGTGTGTVVFKQIMIDEAIASVKLPAIVTYDANGGSFGKASEKYTGTPLVIGNATPADDDFEFEGWHLGSVEGEKINAAAYEPTKNVTLVAKYVGKSSPFSLTALTYKIGSGAATAVGYEEGIYDYTVKLPYAPSYETITVAYTLADGTSSEKAGAVLNVTSVPGAATFTIVAANTTEKTYTVNFAKDAKDGLEIIGATVTGNTSATISGLYGGTASVNLNSKKIDSGGYIYITLPSGYTFEETDVLVVNVNTKADIGSKALEISTGVGNIDGAVWKTIAFADYSTGNNTIALTGIAANQTSIGLKRSSNQNAKINSLKVYRPMNPVLKSITIDGTKIDVIGLTAEETLPYAADLTAVTPEIFWSGSGTAVVTTNAGEWAWGDNTYVLTDKDGDATSYTITLNRAARLSDKSLSSLTVDGNAVALSEGVYDYIYEYPYGTDPATVPVVAAVANDVHASVGSITQAASTAGTASFTVTAEDETTQDYTVKFKISRAPRLVIFDGSAMDAVAEIGADGEFGLAWSIIGANTTSGGSANITVGDKTYTRGVNLFNTRTSSSDHYMMITIPNGYLAKFYLVGGSNGNEERSLFISKEKTDVLDKSIAYATSASNTTAGSMTSDLQIAGDYYLCATKSIRLYELSVQLYPIDYSRDVTPKMYGTICLPNGGYMVGATIFEVAHMTYENEKPYKVFFDEVLNGVMVAGMPYIFLPEEGATSLAVTYTDAAGVTAGNELNYNGLHGTLSLMDGEAIYGKYIFYNNSIFMSENPQNWLNENRAYIVLSEVPDYITPLAPGRRRVSMGFNGTNTATGLDEIGQNSKANSQKLLINGQLFILRGEKIYDATGRLVK